MSETSTDNEDLIDEMEDQEEDDELFGIKGNDHESEDRHGYEIERLDHENDSEQFLEIDANIHVDNEQVELEGEDHCSDSQQYLEIRDHNEENDTFQVLNLDGNDQENNLGNDIMGMDDENSLYRENYYHPPVVGMEFESYDDAYNYYNCYAKELGFAIRVKSSWTKRNSKEKRGAVLCCNCEGFKSFKEATCRRKDTRTGCLAMIRLRLVETNRWRVDEVKLEHNHLFDPERVQNSKSHKKMEVGTKRNVEATVDVEVRTIKLYRTSVTDATSSWNLTSRGEENSNHFQSFLKLDAGDSQAIQNYFCQKQLTSPNFFYIIDLNDEGQMRNVFWIDSRARAAYSYFGDVVAVDTTCLSHKYAIPLVNFIGLNHHRQSILLGCAFIAEETVENYIWLFRTWLTCMSGRPPQTIVTDQFKAIQSAVSDVFPRAHHRIWLTRVMQSILLNLSQLQEYEAFQSIFNRTVYNYLKSDEFEASWDNMMEQFGIRDLEWLQFWYEEREKWVPVYQKDTLLAGLFTAQSDESIPFFAGHVHERTSVKEFFELYDVVAQKKQLKEALDDLESSESNLLLRTRCYYELQLSKFYTTEIFEKFQVEVEMMSGCMTINQVHTSGPVITYLVKECEGGGGKEFRNFEVMYDKAAIEVRCVCGGFYLNGYLCRHALSILNHNCVEEIPFSYILQRWRKDCKRLYVPDLGSNVVDVSNPTQWYDHLHKRATQVIEAGMVSQDHYMVAWQAFRESLNKVRLTEEKHV